MKHGSYETPNLCSFYKIMLTPTIQSKKLRLPESFSSAFGDELSNVCHLTVPTGESYRVALVEESNTQWFQDGWEQLVNHFSIGYGYFMIFTYDGNSNFRVNLFDLTGCEIPYLCDEGTSSSMEDEPYHGDLSTGFSDEFNGDLSSGFSDEFNGDDCEYVRGENSNSPSASPVNSAVEVIELDSDDDRIKLEELSLTISETSEESEGFQPGTELRTGAARPAPPRWLKRYQKEMRHIAASGIPMPGNPFFMAFITPYTLKGSGYLNIPNCFFRKHMKCKAGDNVRVEMSNGKQWAIRFCRTGSHCCLGKGWVKFVRHAGLELGDVTLFELITNANNNHVFEVHIVKRSQMEAARHMV